MDNKNICFDDLFISIKNSGALDWIKWYYQKHELPLNNLYQDVIRACYPSYGDVPFSYLLATYLRNLLYIHTQNECSMANDNDDYGECYYKNINRQKKEFNIVRKGRIMNAHIKAIKISHLPFRKWPQIHTFDDFNKDEFIKLHSKKRSPALRL